MMFAGSLLAACSSEESPRKADPSQLVDKELPEQSTPNVEPVRKGVRVIVEDEVATLAEETEVIQRLPPVQSAAERNADQIARLPQKPDTFPRPLVLGANDIVSGEITIKLTGIDAPEVSRTCERADGSQWPCGNFAKAAVQRLIRARTLSCEGDFIGETIFSGSCKVGQIDVGEWLVEQGWAIPRSEGMKTAGEKAKQAGKGLWQR